MTNSRQSGSIMLELMIGMSLLLVGILSFMNSFMSNYQAFSTVNELDEVHVAFENISETLFTSTFEDVYTNFNGTAMEVPNLYAPDGSPAAVQVTCFVNETQIPAEFGPIPDLDGNPYGDSTDVSTTYRVLPVRLSVSYATSTGNRTRELYLVLDPE